MEDGWFAKNKDVIASNDTGTTNGFALYLCMLPGTRQYLTPDVCTCTLNMHRYLRDRYSHEAQANGGADTAPAFNARAEIARLDDKSDS